MIDDINDHSPHFTQPLYQATMSENFPKGASITSVSATDLDIGHNAKLTYTLKEQDREYFYISSIEATNTGVLKVFRVNLQSWLQCMRVCIYSHKCICIFIYDVYLHMYLTWHMLC